VRRHGSERTGACDPDAGAEGQVLHDLSLRAGIVPGAVSDAELGGKGQDVSLGASLARRNSLSFLEALGERRVEDLECELNLLLGDRERRVLVLFIQRLRRTRALMDRAGDGATFPRQPPCGRVTPGTGGRAEHGCVAGGATRRRGTSAGKPPRTATDGAADAR